MSDFQAKYQKLLVRALGPRGKSPPGEVPRWGGAGGCTERSSGLSGRCASLQAGSQQRQQDLNSLQDYMQRCTNKLYWLDQQAKDRTHYDWSDHNLDYPSRRRQYEVCALPRLAWAKGSWARGQGSWMGAGNVPSPVPPFSPNPL